ncbi:MAG: SPOR domain-containing protein [Thermodesulfobacteriota bacterium]
MSIPSCLKQDGNNSYLSEKDIRNRQWYRVRVCFYATQEQAKSAGEIFLILLVC